MTSRQGELPGFGNIPMFQHVSGQPRVQSRLPAAAGGTWADVPQYIAMVLLWERDGQTVGELGSGSSGIKHRDATAQAAVNVGHIKRRRDLADERQVRIYLTEAGRKLANGP
jgi:hypothetical protein